MSNFMILSDIKIYPFERIFVGECQLTRFHKTYLFQKNITR